MSKKDNDIRLVKIEGENIRKLCAVAVRLDGKPGLFRITGENESGKTTFLDITSMLFGGAKAVKRETIQEGRDGAWCRAELSNGYSIERRFTAAAPDGYLDVITPDNASVKSPQAVLDGWAGPHSWDPGALLRKKISEIEAIILGLAKDPNLKAKRQAISEKRQALQEERLPYNRELQRSQRTQKPEGQRPEPVDVSGEMERLEELKVTERSRRRLEEQVRSEESEAVNADRRMDAINEEIKRLEAERDGLKAVWKDAQAAMKEGKKNLDAIPDPTEEIEAVYARVREADEVAEALEPWKEYERSQREAGEAKEKAAAITVQIKALDAEEEALLKAADIPVRGIGFSSSGEMQLDGHALEVASGMRKLDMACDVAFAANPDVKVVLLNEANDYGLPALEALNARSEEKGWQVLACRIGLEGPGEIIVEDGEARSAS